MKKKISDSIKPWERRTQSSYQNNTFAVNLRFLILCEGQTEKEYFDSFDLSTKDVVCINCKGCSKQRLIDECDKRVEKYKQQGKEFDQIWCVFDMDVHKGENEYAEFDNAIISGTKKGYKIAYSNDAFELWFYLHFQLPSQANHRTFYYSKLSNYLGYNYEKEGKTLEKCKTNYDLLKDKQEKAIKNAKQLLDRHGEIAYHKRNPGTTVHHLVETLNTHLRGSRRS